MFKRRGILLSVISALIAFTLLAGVAYMTYQVGFNQGILAGEHINLQEMPAVGMPMRHFYPPIGFGGLLIGMLLLFMVMGMFRRAFFFSGWRHYGPHGPGGPHGRRFMRHPYWGAWEVDDDESGKAEKSDEPAEDKSK